MKKNIVVIILVLALCFSIIIGSNKQSLLMKHNQDLNEKNTDYEIKVLNLEHEKNTIKIELNNQIDNYESLLKKWLSYSDESTFEMLRKAYDIKAVIHTDDRSFEIPKNGIVYIDSDFFILEIELKRPPILSDPEINERIHFYRNVVENIEYDKTDDLTIKDDYIKLRYDNLEIGDKVNFRIFNELYTLLNLNTHNLEVVIADDFSSAKEYFPDRNMKKIFTGGYENGGYTEIYDFASEDICYVKIEDTGADMTFKYDLSEGVRITEVSRDDEGFIQYDRYILPKTIKIGETWTDSSRVATITAIDIPIQTIIGEVNTIEVTYENEGSYGDFNKIVYYYAKGLGAVYKRIYGMEDILIDLE